jgi:hypothetical protein
VGSASPSISESSWRLIRRGKLWSPHHFNQEYIFAIENSQAHQDNFVALRNAAQAGCEFCDMVLAHHERDYLDRHAPAHMQDMYKYKCKCKHYPGPLRLVIDQNPSHKTPILSVLVVGKKDIPHSHTVARFEMCTAKGIWFRIINRKGPANLTRGTNTYGRQNPSVLFSTG